MKAIYCDECEDYTEVDGGRCIICNNKVETKKERVSLDEWEENDEEWGTEDEAEEIQGISGELEVSEDGMAETQE